MTELSEQRRHKVFGALRMASKHLLVFPVKPYVEPDDPTPENLAKARDLAKQPAFVGWRAAATQSRPQVEAWWRENPDYNIGISTTGLLVVDLDPKDDGPKNWDDILALREMMGEEPLPETFQVKTWSGGRHLYFWAPEGVDVRGSVGKNGGIAPGIDIRATGGLVVGPGSYIEGKSYDIIEPMKGHKIAMAPAWLVEKAGRKRERLENAGERVTDETPEAIEKAREIALSHEEVSPGARNTSLHRLAARFGDLGLEVHTAREVLHEWIEAKVPGGIDEDEFEKTLASAYSKSRLNPIGCGNPGALPEGFEPVDPGPPPGVVSAAPTVESVEIDWLRPKWRQDIMATAAEIPPLTWFIDHFAIRNKVAVLTGPGGVAKSTLGIHIALEGASGIKGICGLEVLTRERTWIYNQEDDEDDIARRVAAVMQHKGIKDADLMMNGRSMLSWNSGVKHRLIVANPINGTAVVNHKVLLAMRNYIIGEGIGLLVLDPLAEFHDLNENANGEMRMVLGAIRDYLAAGTGCTVLVIAHPVKAGRAGSENLVGNMDSLRGAGSQGNSVRGAATLYRPTKADIKSFRFTHPPMEYARLDFAKSNFGKLQAKPIWYHITEVTIANGEQVGVLDHVQLHEKITMEEDLLEPFAAAVKACGPGAHQWVAIKPHIAAGARPAFEAMGRNNNLPREITDKIMLGKDEVTTATGRLTRSKLGERYRYSFAAALPKSS